MRILEPLPHGHFLLSSDQGFAFISQMCFLYWRRGKSPGWPWRMRQDTLTQVSGGWAGTGKPSLHITAPLFTEAATSQKYWSRVSPSKARNMWVKAWDLETKVTFSNETSHHLQIPFHFSALIFALFYKKVSHSFSLVVSSSIVWIMSSHITLFKI